MYYKIYPTIARYYKLQGAKKDLFFLINSFRENKQPFYASVQHIADVININRRNVYPLLKELITEKLIEKIENGINFTYQISDETSQKCDELSQIEMKHLKESEMIHLKKCDETSQNGDETSQKCDETSPNIKEYTNYNLMDNITTNYEFQQQANDKLASINFRNSKDYQFIKDVYKQVYSCNLPRMAAAQLVVIQNWFKEIPEFPNTFELVLMYFKEKYKWANNPHPPFSWLIKDGLNYQSVYNEWVEKEGKYILGEL